MWCTYLLQARAARLLEGASVKRGFPISTDVPRDAAKRIHEGIEGTLMGWIRASLWQIGFGFALFHPVSTGGSKALVGMLREYRITAFAVGLVILGVFGLLPR